MAYTPELGALVDATGSPTGLTISFRNVLEEVELRMVTGRKCLHGRHERGPHGMPCRVACGHGIV